METVEQALAREMRDPNRTSSGQTGHPLLFISEPTRLAFLAAYPAPDPATLPDDQVEETPAAPQQE